MPLRNQEALTNLLRQLYDPANPNFRHYLSPEQFTERFGPTERDYQAVTAFAQSNGLIVTARHRNRMLLDVQGAVADIEKAFHVNLLVYPHPTERRVFYAPDGEPSLDLAVPVIRIAGLDNYALPHPANLRMTPGPQGGGGTPNGGSGPGGNYLGNDFRAAYAPGVALTGAGQALGLVEFDGYYTNDIAAYETLASLPNVTVTNILLDSFDGTPGPANDEVALDIELAISMSPGLSQVIVYEAGPQGSVDDILDQMASDNLAKQLSSSWLWNGGNDPIANQIFREFAAQGQSFFNASGDYDAYSGAIPFPADNPFITVVGGTSLSTAQDGSWSSETVWNMNDGEGSSGGVSPAYLIPEWQQDISMTNNQGSTTHRNLPDVALAASGIWVVSNNGQGSSFAGTSCAAPLWAAFTALVNQQAAAYGQPSAGFLNPAIYALGQQTNYAACFHDITRGNNTNSLSPTQFFAAAGYDLCTGWGTPAGQALIDALQPPDYLVISPQAGFSAYGLPGGPFNPTSQTFTLTNHGPAALSWSVGSTSIWLSVAPIGGTLAASGAAAQVQVSLGATAYNLPAGVYNAGIFFTNLSTGVVRGRQFGLQVAQSLVRNGGFETGDFSDWSLTGSTLANYVSSGSPITPHSGNYAAALGQYGSLAYLSQTLPTSPGQPYLLSFWLENPEIGTPNQFLANWGTNSPGTNAVFSVTDAGAFAWTNVQLLVRASGTNTALQFGARNDQWFFGLDDVTVTPVPVPRLEIGRQAGGSIIFSWPALVGLVYQVQYRIDLVQGNWRNLGGAVTATNETMSASDSPGPDEQRLYRVVLSP